MKVLYLSIVSLALITSCSGVVDVTCSGHVYDEETAAPLQGVEVTLDGHDIVTLYTDESGYFKGKGHAITDYVNNEILTLYFNKNGYQQAMIDIMDSGDKKTGLEVYLYPYSY